METCRTCAKCDFENETNWLDLFHATRWQNEIEHIHVEFCNWKLQIAQNDGLPQKICSDCFSKFCTVYAFRMECQEAQTKLCNIFDKIEEQSMEADNRLSEMDAERRILLLELESDAPSNDILLNMFDFEGDIINEAANESMKNSLARENTQTRQQKQQEEETQKQQGVHEREPDLEEEQQQQQVSASTVYTAVNDYSMEIATQQISTDTENLIQEVDDLIEEDFTDDMINADDDDDNISDSDINSKNIHNNDINAITDDNENDEDDGVIEQFEPITIANPTTTITNNSNTIDTNSTSNYINTTTTAIATGCATTETETNTNSNLITVNGSISSSLNLQNLSIEYNGGGSDIEDLDDNENFDANDFVGIGVDHENEEISITFECKFCYKTKATPSAHYLTQRELLVHITETHNSELPFNCPNCEQCFQDAASRTVHIKSEHVEKHYKCDVCDKKYADRFNLRHHIEKYHSDTDFECTLCEKRFYSRKSLNYHMKWHNPERQLKCSYCDRLFINQRHLKCHEETHTGLRNCEYCTFCGKSFIHLKTLRWHIFRQHGGEKPFKCGNCTEVFSSYLEKRIHMLENHLVNLTTMEKAECMLCHKRFENELDLKEHLLNDHQPRSKTTTLIISNNKRVVKDKRQKSYSGIFKCDVSACNRRFNMKSALERHSAVHSTEGRPHECPQCAKRFKRSQDMNWHMKTHSNEKPNICDVCGKGFALKYVLTQHKRSHEVLEKNFKCETCGRAYLFEKSLRMHERVHTGKTYYKCDLCSESFVTHIKFKYHMRKKHNDPNANSVNDDLPLDELINTVIP